MHRNELLCIGFFVFYSTVLKKYRKFSASLSVGYISMVLVVDNHNKNISKMKRPQVRFESVGCVLRIY